MPHRLHKGAAVGQAVAAPLQDAGQVGPNHAAILFSPFYCTYVHLLFKI